MQPDLDPSPSPVQKKKKKILEGNVPNAPKKSTFYLMLVGLQMIFIFLFLLF